MRGLLFGLLLLVSPAWGQAPVTSPADRAAIAATIQSQLGAFQRDDAAGSFEAAAPSIREMFGTADRFLAMVRTGYPPVYRPREVDFGELQQVGDQLVQKVELVGPDGSPVLALYVMERQPDGNWKIAGCSLTVSERVGA
jgi:hypothetical protein